MQKFYDILDRIRYIVSASVLEREAKLPKNCLGKHYAWADGKEGWPCNPDHVPAIIRAICRIFGTIEIDGWRVTVSDDSPGFFFSRPIPGRDAQVVEVDGVFEYHQPEWRMVYGENELHQFFMNV